MIINENITGIILSGGKSTRMGSNKAMLSFNGKKMIEYGISAMKEVCRTVIIGANTQAYNAFNIPVVPDNYQNMGPLAGLEACLRHSQTRKNLITPCDTPFLNVEFLKTIISNIENYDAVVPILKDGKIEPLTGYYSKDILPIIVSQIENGDYKIQNLLKAINTKYIVVENVSVLKNINTPNDLIINHIANPLINYSNILLIAGNGQNVGKTLLACDIIRHLSQTNKVIGIKIAHHFYPIENGEKVVFNSAYYQIIEEVLTSNKDSSRMKQAGAKKVFYIQAKQEYLLEAISTLSSEIEHCAVVCESGGLHHYIKPSLFLFVKGTETPNEKKSVLNFNPIIVTYTNGVTDINVADIQFSNNCFTINSTPNDNLQ